MKKGQITIFIIVTIIIIAIVGTVIYLGKSKIDSENSKQFFAQSNIKPELNNIQDSIINCIDETSKQALILIGIQGGYYEKPPQAFDMSWAFIPYYYNQGQQLMPTKTMITNQLQQYTNEKTGLCLNKINLGDFTLEYKNLQTTTQIQKQQVKFTIDTSITIEKENNKIKFETKEHPTTINSKLYEILEIADFITTSHNENPDLICINCVAQMSEERDVYTDMLEFDEQTTLIIISENKTSSEPYIFEFLNKYE
ncbi:hypothetical protein HOE04_03630 [archaeon]|jgi:flagellar basal body-associated protein FliL|nr:hypothetical protein [archaeon]